MNAKTYALLALVATATLPTTTNAAMHQSTCLAGNLNNFGLEDYSENARASSAESAQAEASAAARPKGWKCGTAGEGNGEPRCLETACLLGTECEDAGGCTVADPCDVDPDCDSGAAAGADTSCTGASKARWWHAHVSCDYLCPKSAYVFLEAIGGTLGYPGKIEGNAGCGGADCENPAGMWCMDYGFNQDLTSTAVCSADNYGAGMTNVAVTCIAFGCGAPCDAAGSGGASYRVDAPGFDLSVVQPGDALCMPLDGAPACLTIHPQSITLFNGPEDYMPLGLRCEAGACLPVEF